MLIAFYKPFGVLSQFTQEHPGQRTLAEFAFPPRTYPLGRLDADSEGLLLLADEQALNAKLLNPAFAHRRIYWVQVEREISRAELDRLAAGLMVQGRKTLPCRAERLDHEPELPPRDPPIRFRKSVPTCWIGLELTEGKNRQVRRMTAAVGHPTLRLVRVAIGQFRLGDLRPGQWRVLTGSDRKKIFSG